MGWEVLFLATWLTLWAVAETAAVRTILSEELIPSCLAGDDVVSISRGMGRLSKAPHLLVLTLTESNLRLAEI